MSCSVAGSLDAALARYDSANALRLARWFVDSVMPGIGRLSVGIGFSDGWRLLLVPRVMLRRADLAAGLGYYAQARVWYDRVLDLWAEADPELRPAVEGIRARRMALGER